MMAVKFHDDIYFDNLAFEKGGGVAASQLFTF
jgi:predicted outer membrane repeat protein